MPLAGIRLVRQHFSDLLPPGYSLAHGWMHHERDEGAEGITEWQVLTFHVIDPGGKTHVVKSGQGAVTRRHQRAGGQHSQKIHGGTEKCPT